MIKEYKLFKNENSCPELGIKREFDYETEEIESPEALYKLMQEMFGIGKLFVEHNYLVTYDMNRKLIGIVELAHGDTNKVATPLKELFICALLMGAHEIVTIHNHPNNLLEASPEDIDVKNMVQKCCNLLNIRYLDDIIIGREGYLSFTDEDLM